MAYQEKQLAQVRENSTNAVSVYSPGIGVTAIIRNIMIVNTSAAVATVRVFHDDNGSTYDQSTAIAPGYDITIAAGDCVQIDSNIAMNNSSGNLAYRSSVANALTITLYGVEIS